MNTVADQALLQLYRVATYVTFTLMDDAAMIAFVLSLRKLNLRSTRRYEPVRKLVIFRRKS